MGQSGEQGRIIEILRSSLQVLVEERGWSSVLVASDNFFAWIEGEPFVQISPDVYLVDYPALSMTEPGDAASGPSARSITARMVDEPLPRRWELWRPDHRPPRLVIEIVSRDWKKDYHISPDRYARLGVQELVLVDPAAFSRDLSKAGRAPFLVFRRDSSGELVRAYRGREPAYCASIDAFLSFRPSPEGAARIRICRDDAGIDIVCTAWEKAAAAERKAAAAEAKAAARAAEIATLRACLHGPEPG